VRIHLKVQGLQIQRSNEKFLIYHEGKPQDLGLFDHVIVAASPGALTQVASKLIDRNLLQKWTSLPALGVRVVLLSLKEALNPEKKYYWYSLRRTKEHPFLALVEHTTFVPAEQFGGEHMIYLATYLDTQDPDWKTSDEEVLKCALRTCAHINPALNRSL